jgi:signal transduction histidine kinase
MTVDTGTLASVGLDVVATAILARVAVVAWRSDRPSARSFATLVGAFAVWGSLTVVQSVVPQPTATDVLAIRTSPVSTAVDTLQFLTVVGIPVLWLSYTYAYSGRERRVTPLTVVPVAVGVASIVSTLAFGRRVTEAPDDLGLVTVAIGVLFLFELLLLLAVFGYAVVSLVRVARERPRVPRTQVAVLTGAVAAPYVPDPVLSFPFEVVGGPVARVVASVDGLTLGFLIAGGLFTVAVRSYPVLAGFPRTDAVARSRVVADLQEAVVVVDHDDRVLDLNAAARETFAASCPDPVGDPVDEVIEGIEAEALAAGTTGTVELRTANGRRRFGFSVSPVSGTAATTTGDRTHSNDIGGGGDGDDVGGEVETDTEAGDRPDRESANRPLSVPGTRAESAPLARAVLLRDVTDRRTREQQLSVLNRVLRHNLRNDLDVVLAHADEIEDDDTRVAIRETATDLLALGRKAREAQSVVTACAKSTSAVDLADLARSVAVEYDREHEDAAVGVVSPGLEQLTVSTHPDVLRRALDELVENAVTHAETPTVEVRVTEPPDAAAAVAVADDGPGIPEREQTVLNGGRETQVEHATGVGLWFVAWAVTQLGGDLRFDENEPRGSVVTLRLYGTPDRDREQAF